MKKDRGNHKPVTKGSTVFHSKTQIGDNAYVLLENEGDEDVSVAMEFKLSLFKQPDETEFDLAAGEQKMITLEGEKKKGGGGGMGGMGGMMALGGISDLYE